MQESEKKYELSAEELQNIRELLLHESDYRMPDEVADEFLTSGEVITIDKWQNIISAGDMNPDIYIVIEGIMRCWYWDNDKEVTAFFSTIPTMAISYHCYYGNLPSFYNFQACTPVKLIHIKRERFNQLIEQHHEFARWNMRVAINQLYYFEIKRDLNQGKAKDKYISLVKTFPNIMNAVPLQIVASYLGITPQHLSRLRKAYLYDNVRK